VFRSNIQIDKVGNKGGVVGKGYTV